MYKFHNFYVNWGTRDGLVVLPSRSILLGNKERLIAWGAPLIGVLLMGIGLATHNLWVGGIMTVACIASIFIWLPVAYRYWGEIEPNQDIKEDSCR